MSTWVLLRGLARERRHWGDFPAQLQAALPAGSAVLTLDLPGNGALNRLRSPARVAAMVDAYRAQLRALGVAGPVVLLGLSLGAMAAAQWAGRHPGEVAACILVNCSAAGLSPPWQRLRPGAWPLLLAAAWPGRSVAQREAALLQRCSNAAPAGTAARWVALAREAPTRPGNALRQLLAAWRFRLPREAPGVPVLVLGARGDRLVDPRCPAAIARAWGAALQQHPAAGHELALDAPGWLAAQAARFLAGQGVR